MFLALYIAIMVVLALVVLFVIVALFRAPAEEYLDYEEKTYRKWYVQYLRELEDDMEILTEQEMFGGMKLEALIYNVQKRIIICDKAILHIRHYYSHVAEFEARANSPFLGIFTK